MWAAEDAAPVSCQFLGWCPKVHRSPFSHTLPDSLLAGALRWSTETLRKREHLLIHVSFITGLSSALVTQRAVSVFSGRSYNVMLDWEIRKWATCQRKLNQKREHLLTSLLSVLCAARSALQGTEGLKVKTQPVHCMLNFGA